MNMVPEAGLEPALLSKSDFESDASTNFTTRANSTQFINKLLIEIRLYLCIDDKQGFSFTNCASA